MIQRLRASIRGSDQLLFKLSPQQSRRETEEVTVFVVFVFILKVQQFNRCFIGLKTLYMTSFILKTWVLCSENPVRSEIEPTTGRSPADSAPWTEPDGESLRANSGFRQNRQQVKCSFSPEGRTLDSWGARMITCLHDSVTVTVKSNTKSLSRVLSSHVLIQPNSPDFLRVQVGTNTDTNS